MTIIDETTEAGCVVTDLRGALTDPVLPVELKEAIIADQRKRLGQKGSDVQQGCGLDHL